MVVRGRVVRGAVDASRWHPVGHPAAQRRRPPLARPQPAVTFNPAANIASNIYRTY